jgi:DNA-binding IclR family transcriptional regulator
VSAPIASSLDKALSLLFAFAEPGSTKRVFTVSALAETLGMDKAQVSRALATFAKYGMVERLDGRNGYQLGWSLVPLASRSLTAQTMSALYPELSRLSVELGETVHFQVRDAATRVPLAAFVPNRTLYAAVHVGRAEPLLGSAVGHALLSRSDEPDVRALFDAQGPASRTGSWSKAIGAVRSAEADGYAVHVDGDEVTTIAAAIHDIGNYHGRVYAAIAVSAPAFRFEAQRERILERIVDVSAMGSRYLEARGTGK